MARKRYTADQIVSILREAERGLGTKETCHKHGVTEQTFYRWRKQYGGLGIPEVQRINQLEKENRRLKQLVGDQALAMEVIKERLEKKGAF
jgi:putative transposase